MTGLASPIKRCSSVVRVVLHDDETLENLLWRFNETVRREHERPWYKHRYGYYEAPSRLRRKRDKMQALRQQGDHLRRMDDLPSGPRLKLAIDLDTLFARTGPNAAGR